MAAGRVDVSRRRDYNGHSKKYFDFSRNGSIERDVVYKDEYHGTSSSYFRRTGISCRVAERVSGYFQDGSILDRSSRLEDGEIPKNDDGILLPPQKKRKFSPILWDLDGKVQLKNSVLPATSAACSLSPPNACSKRLHNVTGAGVAKDSVSAAAKTIDLELVSGELSPTAISFPSSPPEKYSIDPQNEEGELAEARHISMSRWASEDDSPVDANISGEQEMGKESDDDRVEVVGGYRIKSSGSGGRASSSGSCDEDEYFRDQLKDDDSGMDTDESLDENDDVNRTHDGSAEIKELNTSAHRGINMLEGCRSVYDYEKLHQINEGTYGVVYKARDKKTGDIVALKKVKMDVGGDRNLEDYGFPLSALREINILASFHHPSIVNVKEIVMSGLDGVFMVMEYMEHDLKGLMQAMKRPFSTSEVKCLMLQLLQGVKYLHDNWVLHRDLKTSNLLVNDKGELKICDFGMSRQYGSPLKPYTSLVVTLWYRAPELLLGGKQYSTAIDMWSVGCIMAELLGKEPLFKGKSEIDQLTKIFRVLGTPSEAIWPGYSKLPGSKANFVKQPYNLLRKKFPKTSFTGSPVLSESGFDLLNKLLAYDPQKRITVDEALCHAWFREDPYPQYKELKPTPPQCASMR